jgi:hypothetical protein
MRDGVGVPTPGPAIAPAPDVPQSQASPVSSPLGFSLHYDADMQRLILEVREPVTGYVIYQMPPKYVIKQFSATSSTTAPRRGTRINSAV